MFDALESALADEDSSEAKEALLIEGIAKVPLQDYAALLDFEVAALQRGYVELHATSTAIVA